MSDTWHRRHGRQRASKHTLAILDAIEPKLAAYVGPRPVVTSIRIGAGLRDVHDFETEVELAPGTTLAVRYQSMDEEDRQADSLENEGGAVAWQVVDTVRQFREHGIEALADLLHDMRMRTRKALAEWSAAGTHATLIDIRIVRTEHWGPDDALSVEVRVRALDDRLRPAIATMEVTRPDLFDGKLAEWAAVLNVHFAAQAALARQGADGLVDRLALNAIAQRWDVGEALRGIAAGIPYGLSQNLTVFVYDGHVQCHGCAAGGDLAWNRSSVVMDGHSIPAAVATALLGKSIRALVEHPVLSDDMIISHVSSTFEHGVHSVRAEFDQPRLLFCSTSGRVWQPAN